MLTCKVTRDNQDIKDQKDSIIRPCRLHDTNCIRHFFAQDFQCLPTEGPVHDPLELQDSIYVPVPHANLTYILNNPIIRGLNKWKIEEFFINKDTQRLVLEVVFDRIDVTCPQADLIYHRKGKEPLKGWDSTFIEYKDLSFTLTISYGKDAKSFNSHVYTFIPDAYPKYSIQPATHEYKDPGFKKALADLEGDVPLTVKELFNKATDVLVLEVEFDRIVVSSTRVKIIYHRRGEEPLQVSDYSIIEYCGVSLTLTIPHIQYLQLSGAHVFSYIPDATPRYTLGPAIYKVKDRGFRQALKEMVTSLGLSIQEVFVNQGSVIMSVFLQSIICDFRHL
ncbi:uncharacterized protein LOC126054859 [Helicoverpa armigera]|uniref:uncharacterized protein LOC126054859 n=1 Tax=Helicoverpa armigera TaxID=29058 RepID=UPI0030826FE3